MAVQSSKACVHRYLCDEALDTEALREALSQRVDGAEEVKKEMREDIAEDKRKLKVSASVLAEKAVALVA